MLRPVLAALLICLVGCEVRTRTGGIGGSTPPSEFDYVEPIEKLSAEAKRIEAEKQIPEDFAAYGTTRADAIAAAVDGIEARDIGRASEITLWIGNLQTEYHEKRIALMEQAATLKKQMQDDPDPALADVWRKQLERIKAEEDAAEEQLFRKAEKIIADERAKSQGEL